MLLCFEAIDDSIGSIYRVDEELNRTGEADCGAFYLYKR